MVSQLYRFGL